MSQRTGIIILAAFCLLISGYLVLSSLLFGTSDSSKWEEATRTYIEEYHSWLSNSPGSGWARVRALAAGSEGRRIEELRNHVQDKGGWRYVGGDFHLLLQTGGKALVEANYLLEGGGEKRQVHEAYLLEKTIQGIRVIKVMQGGQ